MIKLLEALFHDFPELLEPQIDFFHFFYFKFVIDLPPLLVLMQQITFRQDPQML